MSENEKQELQNKIIKNLESDIKKVENTLGVMKEKLRYLKDIVWDRQSEMEREQMLKVLNGEKESTEVKSNIGSILVDSELTEKMKKKHLDNPNLRGMVTSEEFLSFPKVAKNVEPEKEARGYTWQVKADDENVLTYGSRKYEFNNKEVHKLATNHSKTEANERMAEEDRRGHPYHPIFNDLNFRKSANEASITQNQIQSQAMNKLDETISKLDEAIKEQSARISKPKLNYEEQENRETNNENLEKHRKRNTK